MGLFRALLLLALFSVVFGDNRCQFESKNGFYVNIDADLPIGEKIMDASVSPPDAELKITSVRLKNLTQLEWSDHLVIDRLNNGHFLIRLASSLSLPVYPSVIRETDIYVTVECNKRAHALLTIHLQPTNRFAPQFYHQPYVMRIASGMPVGSVVETPVAAIDWDPATSYNLSFRIEHATGPGFELVESRTRTSELIDGSGKWPAQQQPTLLRLRVVDRYSLPLTLRLIATDNDPLMPKSSMTFIEIERKPETDHELQSLKNIVGMEKKQKNSTKDSDDYDYPEEMHNSQKFSTIGKTLEASKVDETSTTRIVFGEVGPRIEASTRSIIEVSNRISGDVKMGNILKPTKQEKSLLNVEIRNKKEEKTESASGDVLNQQVSAVKLETTTHELHESKDDKNNNSVAVSGDNKTQDEEEVEDTFEETTTSSNIKKTNIPEKESDESAGNLETTTTKEAEISKNTEKRNEVSADIGTKGKEDVENNLQPIKTSHKSAESTDNKVTIPENNSGLVSGDIGTQDEEESTGNFETTTTSHQFVESKDGNVNIPENKVSGSVSGNIETKIEEESNGDVEIAAPEVTESKNKTEDSPTNNTGTISGSISGEIPQEDSAKKFETTTQEAEEAEESEDENIKIKPESVESKNKTEKAPKNNTGEISGPISGDVESQLQEDSAEKFETTTQEAEEAEESEDENIKIPEKESGSVSGAISGDLESQLPEDSAERFETATQEAEEPEDEETKIKPESVESKNKTEKAPKNNSGEISGPISGDVESQLQEDSAEKFETTTQEAEEPEDEETKIPEKETGSVSGSISGDIESQDEEESNDDFEITTPEATRSKNKTERDPKNNSGAISGSVSGAIGTQDEEELEENVEEEAHKSADSKDKRIIITGRDSGEVETPDDENAQDDLRTSSSNGYKNLKNTKLSAEVNDSISGDMDDDTKSPENDRKLVKTGTSPDDSDSLSGDLGSPHSDALDIEDVDVSGNLSGDIEIEKKVDTEHDDETDIEENIEIQKRKPMKPSAKSFGLKTHQNSIDSEPEELISMQHAAARFEQCSYRVTIAENSPIGTIVTHLNILNRSRNTTLRLVDPDGTFRLDSDDVIVANPKLLDRELFGALEIIAEIQGSSQSTQCSRARIRVELRDVNDNRPVFEKERYFFHVSSELPIGSVVGYLHAQDIDQGANGYVTYRLLTEGTPFQVGTQGRRAVILSVAAIGANSSYELMVEARDHGEPEPRVARVPVDVFILRSKLNAKAEGVVAQNSQPVRLAEFEEESTSRGFAKEPSSSEEEEEDDSGRSSFRSSKKQIPAKSIKGNRTSSPSESSISSKQSMEESSEELPDEQKSSSSSHTKEEIRDEVEAISREKQEESSETKPSRTDDLPQPDLRTPLKKPEQNENTDDYDEEPSNEPSGMTNIDLFLQRQNELIGSSPPPAPFHFRKLKYRFDVYGREWDVTRAIGRVEAMPNAQFYAVDRSAAGIVTIDDDGVLMATRRLDEFDGSPNGFEFGISATDGIHTAKSTVAIVRNSSRDADSGLPRFSSDSYEFHVPENKDPFVFGQVQTFHQSPITYSVLPPSTPVAIHDGYLATNRALDAETERILQFQVQACARLCSTVQVRVLVEDVNDNAPRFLRPSFTATIDSDVPEGTRVLRVYAEDRDATEMNNRIRFEADTDEFHINSTSGQLTTSHHLTQPRYTFAVTATDPQGLQDHANVTINVRGSNPSSPVFDQPEYVFNARSPIRVGQVIGQLHATDPDPGREGIVVYHIQPASRDFSINPSTGVLSALTTITSSSEPIHLQVVARDSASEPRSTQAFVTINVTDSQEITFLPLPSTIYISTEKPVGSVVLRVSATAADPITFQAIQNTTQFVMDGDMLRVANHLVAGDSTMLIRAFTRTATVDHKLRVVVMADRDKYPVFPQLTYDLEVVKEGKYPRVLHQFGAKLANGTIKYRFNPPKEVEGFFLDEATGELYVTSQYKSIGDTIFIVVRAINADYPNFYSDVGVAITPESSGLRFTKGVFNLEVAEDTPVGAIVGRVETTLPAEVFNIEPRGILDVDNGTLILASPLDAETNKVLEFHVAASSRIETATCLVRLSVRDVNEFTPVFSSSLYHASIAADATTGSPIIKLIANDQDANDKLTYRIVGGTARQLVFIQADGTIIVGDAPLMPGNYDLVVECRDKGGRTATTTVQLTVQASMESQDPPQFEDGQWNLGVETSYKLITNAEDPVFRIIDGDDLFSESDGVLTPKKPLEAGHNYSIMVECEDQASSLSTMAQVIVVAPRIFDRPEYEGIENLVADSNTKYTTNCSELVLDENGEWRIQQKGQSIICEVHAIHGAVHDHALLRITTNIAFSESVYQFSINEDSKGSIGRVSLNGSASNALLSFISGDNLHVSSNGEVTMSRAQNSSDVVVATIDGRVLAEARVIVTMSGPRRFNHDVYYANLPEGNYTNRPMELVIKPESFRAANMSIDDPRVPFTMTPDGRVFVKSNIDREELSSYSFSIRGHVNGKLAHARLNVTIDDVNDTPPAIEPHPEVVEIKKGAHVGSPIAQIKASDEDVQDTIRYEITGDSFEIDPKDGLIRIAKELTSAEQVVTVVAIDEANHRTETQLVMRLVDEAPQLPKESAEVVVPVGAHKGSVVKYIAVGNVEPMSYAVRDTDLFEINAQGVLQLAREPQPEDLNKYHQVVVTATNQKGTDSTTLNVYLQGPQFCKMAQRVYRAQVSENIIDVEVAKVAAACRGSVRYEFAESYDKFAIDPSTGRIRVVQPLDRETKSYHMLVVNAIETKRRRVRQSQQLINETASKLIATQALVVVTVVDENDNAPVFLHLLDDGSLAGVIDRNAGAGTVIMPIQARDLDVIPPELKFTLAGSEEAMRHFALNSSTGLLQLTRSLNDFESDHAEFAVTVSDGSHLTTAPLTIYLLSIDTNVVQLTDDQPAADVDVQAMETRLTSALGLDTRVLVTQPFVDDSGRVDAHKSHVFIYSLEPTQFRPIDRDELRRKLVSNADHLSKLHVSSVAVLSSASRQNSSSAILTAVMVVLFLALLIFCCVLTFVVCKRRDNRFRADGVPHGAYMIDTIGGGPRPYDVENISRATAQNVLSARPLPSVKQHVDLALSPAFMEDRGELSAEFSNSVREKSNGARSKIHCIDLDPTNKSS